MPLTQEDKDFIKKQIAYLKASIDILKNHISETEQEIKILEKVLSDE